MTGVALLVVELAPKRLELVRELVPKAAGIGALINPKNTNAARNLTALQEAARVKGVPQARGDLYAIADDLEFLKVQLARIPTRKELARMALGIIFCSAALVIIWFEVWPPIR